jgi:hypothetical protein
MGRRVIHRYAMLVLLSLLAGCAAQFSPSAVRQEIVRQRGENPLSVFEVNIGKFTTLLLRRSLGTSAGDFPFAGVRELQLAVFEVPAGQDPVIDVTRIATRGWDSVVKVHDQQRSGLVLLRTAGVSSWESDNATAASGDLVVIGAGRRSVVYARFNGRLSPKLPSVLGDVVRRGGPDQIRKLFMELSDNAIGG